MKKNLTLLFLTLILPLTSSAAIDLYEGKNTGLSFYGFIKFDGTYQSDGMNNQIAPRFATTGNSSTNFTASHSRFGFKFKGGEVMPGWKLAGLLEWDLFDASPNQMKLRDRQVYLSITNGNSSWLFGQTWDVFSAIGPTTLMTNGYLWQVGNLGFRRAQVRYTYSNDALTFQASVNDATSSGGRDKGVPNLQSRIAIKFSSNNTLGLSGTYGGEERSSDEFDVIGFALDVNIKLSKHWVLKGELGAGENLGIFLSRAKVATDTTSGRLTEQEVVNGWLQTVYTNADYQFWIGLGGESVDNATLVAASIEDTRLVFGGVRRKYSNGFSLAAELAFFDTKTQGSVDYSTEQLILSAQYSF